MQLLDNEELLEELNAATVDWRQRLPITTGPEFVREQGGCGSCWAVAAVGTIEMHEELHRQNSSALLQLEGQRQLEPLSYEQLVDCTPNPRHCGGTGGCKGATGELAFRRVLASGIAPANRYSGYQHNGDGKCKAVENEKMLTYITGWQRLRDNKLQDLLQALTSAGPVVASVDATGWSLYRRGVFAGCPSDAIVNHAVVLTGYGVDPRLGKYYMIRNSWGGGWGEEGFIRLRRHTTDKGVRGKCGIDRNPKEGVGCDGGPAQIEVCGECGILSDISYPIIAP